MSGDSDMAAPPWVALRNLEAASLAFEQDEDAFSDKWLRLLLAPGSSLGGARPKANVMEKDGSLWIAKFPSRNDRQDVGAWEAVAMQLARACGIVVADFDIIRYNRYATFLTRRFDRTTNGKRIHFTSAMTMLGYSDGQTEGCSYLELAEWISRYSCCAQTDLEELWKRIVFNIAISNCDDHLRNHGFLLTKEGWRLAPAYDLNPLYYGNGLSLNINEQSNALDLELTKEVAPYFGIKEEKATKMIDNILQHVATWPQWATRYHISREEQELMSAAFNNHNK